MITVIRDCNYELRSSTVTGEAREDGEQSRGRADDEVNSRGMQGFAALQLPSGSDIPPKVWHSRRLPKCSPFFCRRRFIITNVLCLRMVVSAKSKLPPTKTM